MGKVKNISSVFKEDSANICHQICYTVDFKTFSFLQCCLCSCVDLETVDYMLLQELREFSAKIIWPILKLRIRRVISENKNITLI